MLIEHWLRLLKKAKPITVPQGGLPPSSRFAGGLVIFAALDLFVEPKISWLGLNF